MVAPAAAANGPAPAAAAAAPIESAVEVDASATGTDAGTGGTGTDTPAPEIPATLITPAAPAPAPISLAGLPQLGTIGELAASVTDGPSAARALLATPTGRSLAVLFGLALAIVLFLAVHRRLDRNDPKLASPHSGPDVARFR